MLDETHATISRPAALVVVPDNVVVGRVRVGAQITLNEVSCLIGEAEEYEQMINVTGVQVDGVTNLCRRVMLLQEVVGHLWRFCQLIAGLG